MIEKYTCQKCKKAFLSREALAGHLTYCGVEKIACPICGKKVLHANLPKHQKIHDCPPKYCLECGKQIFDKRAKFCSSSCSAKYNNTRKKKKERICKNCGNSFFGKNTIFCSQKCSAEYRFKQADIEYLKGNIYYQQTLKLHFLFHNDNICSICGNPSFWNGQKLTLILDHIDGDSTNCHPENLRLVCPNCDSQLDTYKSKNKGKGRYYRRERYHNNKSY